MLSRYIQSVFLGALERWNLFGPSKKVLYLKKLVIRSVSVFFILFVLVDVISQKSGLFQQIIGNISVFFALCMYLVIIIDNSLLFYLFIFVLEILVFFPTVKSIETLNFISRIVFLFWRRPSTFLKKKDRKHCRSHF